MRHWQQHFSCVVVEFIPLWQVVPVLSFNKLSLEAVNEIGSVDDFNEDWLLATLDVYVSS